MANVPLPFPYLIFFRSHHPQSEYLWGWLPRMDSNHDKQIQNLQCYRYTTRQIAGVGNIDFPSGFGKGFFGIFGVLLGRGFSGFEDDAESRAALFEAIEGGVDIREGEFLDERGDLMSGTEVEHARGGGGAAEG